MKANAPEKLYYAPYGDIREDYPITDNDIEYTRTDAFIEKAVEYIKEHLFDYWSQSVTDESKFVDGFRKYMKGEEV